MGGLLRLLRPVACIKFLMPPLYLLERLCSTTCDSVVSTGEEIVRTKTQVYINGPKVTEESEEKPKVKMDTFIE